MATKKGGLGRGLDALFNENSTEVGGVTELRLNDIEPNRNQPRKEFDEEAVLYHINKENKAEKKTKKSYR